MKDELKDYYQVLGLSRDATPDEIRKSYLVYAAKFHPDKHNGDPFFEERFREVKEAYEVISDQERRWQYDLRKFRKSKVKRQVGVDFENVREVPAQPASRFNYDIPHLDIYIAVFYFVNLTAWVTIKKVEAGASSAALIWSLFLSVVSALLMWLFVNGVIHIIKKQYEGRKIYLVAFAGLAAASGCFALYLRAI